MKYAVWFVRLIYAAWMIPAGLNHFIRLYPQPTGNKPLSIEVFTALLDSGLFTLVKATELVAGLAVLLGFRLPLLLLAVLRCRSPCGTGTPSCRAGGPARRSTAGRC
jgi:uncharacterized membrane protein YphA (DoxX/SURF4 family)